VPAQTAASSPVAAVAPASSRSPTFGWIVVGAGLVGIGAGTYFVIQSHAKRAELDGLCPDGPCPVSKRNQMAMLEDDSNDFGRLGAIGFAVGGVALVTGLTLALSALPPAKEVRSGFVPYVGFGTAGVRGKF
jgi:hypothetical protein